MGCGELVSKLSFLDGPTVAALVFILECSCSFQSLERTRLPEIIHVIRILEKLLR